MKSETGNRKPETKLVPATDGSAIASYGPGPRFDFSPENPLAAVAESWIAKLSGARRAPSRLKASRPSYGRISGVYPCRIRKATRTFPIVASCNAASSGWFPISCCTATRLSSPTAGTRTPDITCPRPSEEIDAAARTFIRQSGEDAEARTQTDGQ